uniref:Uncharacterized protein n=1 Tax=Manihot esculenta TaxID=3983 RepID=A0A2C9U0T6_MANES
MAIISHKKSSINTTHLLPHHRPLQQILHQPPHSPSPVQQDPRGPQGTLLLPCPHPHTSAQRHASHT